MDINRGSLNALFTAYNQAFRNAFATADTKYQLFSMEIPSGTAIVEFPFLEQIAGMREWIGPRQAQNVSTKKLSITNKTYEKTIAVSVDDVEDDQFGTYTPIFGQMGMAAGNQLGKRAWSALVSNGNWLDGNAVYGTTRTYGSNTINNYTTTALSATTYATAWKNMTQFLGHDSESLNVMPTHLIVGPKLYDTANNIVNDPKLVTSYSADTDDATLLNHVAAPNPWYKTAELVVSTELVGTYDDYWFLVDASQQIKPVVVSNRQSGQLVQRSQANDENVFMDNQILYGAKVRCEAAVAMPHLVYAGIVA